MEFNEKIQELRKQKGYTQEQLADALFVSRTAVSKWESGRGYPNIDSIKALAKFFSISIDELLSGEELLSIAEQDHQNKAAHLRDVIFGLFDCSIAMFLFLPLFRQKSDGIFYDVSLLSLHNISGYLKVGFYFIVFSLVLWGVLTLALQTTQWQTWVKWKTRLSLLLNLIGVVLFVISLQPYAAILLLTYMIIKMFLFIKRS